MKLKVQFGIEDIVVVHQKWVEFLAERIGTKLGEIHADLQLSGFGGEECQAEQDCDEG